MSRRFDHVFLALLVCLIWAQPASARKVAVVVANAAYASSPLANPTNDADIFSIAAQDAGFEILSIRDATGEQMRREIPKAIKAASGAELLLFYYAGHGVQNGGMNFFLPIDITLRSATDLGRQAVSLADVLGWMSASGVGPALVFLDACRNNPLAREGGFEPGLALVESGKGEIIVSYAAAAGDVAYDGGGLHSPYTMALVEALRTPNLEIYELLRKVRARVRHITDGRQIPWVSGSVERTIVLNTRTQNSAPMLRQDGDLLDDTVWNTIRNSSNPAFFEEFAEDFPASPYHGEAMRKLGSLTAQRLTPIHVSYVSPAADSEHRASAPVVDPLVAGIDPCDALVASDADPRRFGLGVPFHAISATEAILACTKAVNSRAGEPRFHYQLARALAVADRWEEAEQFAARAAGLGYPEGYSLLAWISAQGFTNKKDPARAIELWRSGSRLGSPNARSNLGRSYRDGFALPVSKADALYWFQLAATSGEKVAADDLGNMYRSGDGVGQDIDEAIRWYRLGAALGSSNAMTTLGNLYRDGEGVERDSKLAEYWYRLATAAGNRFAPFQRARLVLRRDKRARAEALKLFELAGERGFAQGFAEAAKLLEAGSAKSLPRAYYFYLVAGGNGWKEAPVEAKRIRATLDGAQATSIEREAARWLEENGEAVRISSYAK